MNLKDHLHIEKDSIEELYLAVAKLIEQGAHPVGLMEQQEIFKNGLPLTVFIQIVSKPPHSP